MTQVVRAPYAGKTAIVTGGASGIGRALGAALAGQGARVVLADIDGDAAAQAAEELGPSTAPGGSVVGRRLDLMRGRLGASDRWRICRLRLLFSLPELDFFG
jgi:NAD(P)-dependent dehydrogenase (short-subunit alcohol dehydrogenase family)